MYSVAYLTFLKKGTRKFANYIYGGHTGDNYCFGLEQLPSKGDLLFLTGGEKDVLTLAAHGFHAICFNSETSVIPAKTVRMGQNGRDGVAVQVPATGQDGNGLGQPAVAVQAARERTVSGLQQPLSDAEFMRRYSQPRNYGFNTAVGSGYAMGKNTIRACIHGDQTIMDGQTVKLRLLEPLQAGNLVIPQNTLVAGTGKVQGERLDIVVSSIEYRGNLLPVELAVYDSDGQKGLSVPSSLEQEAAKEAMANIGGGLGTSISFARSAGQQVAMDITRGLMQGGSQYLAKKFRTVKVHLKAGYELMLYAKE